MAGASEKLISSLWSLSGVNQRYLNTLDRIVKWDATVPGPTWDESNEWLMSQYNVGQGIVSGYSRVVITLGALEEQSDGKLTLTRLSGLWPTKSRRLKRR